jgi:hypothetical protein
MKKSCSGCDRNLHITDFYRNQGWCKLCFRLYEYGAKYVDYTRVMEFQNSCCAICRDSSRKLQMDHDPITLIWRGLVCAHCNKGISWAEQTGLIVDIISQYLANYPTRVLNIECIARPSVKYKQARKKGYLAKLRDLTTTVRELS